MNPLNLIRATHHSIIRDLAGSIAHAIRNNLRNPSDELVCVQAVGVQASYNALKAAIAAGKYLAEEGITLLVRPSYVTVAIEGEEKTAVRLEFVINHEHTVTNLAE